MRIQGVRLYFLPVRTRVPYQFGLETLTEVICARAMVSLSGDKGGYAEGWGETPLNVGWVWPGTLTFQERQEALCSFCRLVAEVLAAGNLEGRHPLEIGSTFMEQRLPTLVESFNLTREAGYKMPWLAALVCCSPFDLAWYDAFGKMMNRPVYDTLGPDYLTDDLAAYLEPASRDISFAGKYPADFLSPRQNLLPVWHSVGGGDPLDLDDLTGAEPRDGYPVLLRDWILRDGLRCLKIKLKGEDPRRDYERLVKIARIGRENGVQWLCADYNCTAQNVLCVTETLDRLARDEPDIHAMLLYVEQPFPYELQEFPIDVHAISARKPLLMDESAHDWRLIRRGRELGWSGVALKTCKTQTVAILSLCWARAHGMALMVQDLTNPMLAMIPHALLAAHAGTIMGLESNAPQFYPEASTAEAAIHPGLYRRTDGMVNLSTLKGPGFGYCLEEIHRDMPLPIFS